MKSNSDIVIVLDAPTAEDLKRGNLLTGGYGLELVSLLGQVGLKLQDVTILTVLDKPNSKWFFTKAVGRKGNYPTWGGENPKHISVETLRSIIKLTDRISELNPKVIIPMGELPLFAVTGETGISSWRGSYIRDEELRMPIVPTYDPKKIEKMYKWKIIAAADLSKALKYAEEPENFTETVNPTYILKPTFEQTISYLENILELAETKEVSLATDIETNSGHITEIGFCHQVAESICIPFVSAGGKHYWSIAEEEIEIVKLIRKIFSHKNIFIIGHNWLYDAQYLAKWWGIFSVPYCDTMLLHHAMFCEMEKSLAFVSSLYVPYYTYWKEERTKSDQEIRWRYNCKDCIHTLLIHNYMRGQLEKNGGEIAYQTQMSFFEPVLTMMLRGVRISDEIKMEKETLCKKSLTEYKRKLKAVAGDFNYNSPKQCQDLFYGWLGIKPYRKRGPSGIYTPTVDEVVLNKIYKREALAAPLAFWTKQARQLDKAIEVLNKEKDSDGRMRCSYNLAGTKTYRFSSSENAFGTGQNLQNVTKGHGAVPNLRTPFVADPGYLLFDIDLPQADARVVAWDAEDDELIDMLLDPDIDLHTENAKTIFGHCPDKKHPNRQLAKTGVHAANYMVAPRTLAIALGITVHEAEKFISRWFEAHPKILAWHNKIRHSLYTKRRVSNIWGYNYYFFDRIEENIKEAVAWIPQSTVAITINKGLLNTHKLGVQNLMQVHDSGVGQFLEEEKDIMLPRLRDSFTVEIPYKPRPLVMVPDVDYGYSWGDLKTWDGC